VRLDDTLAEAFASLAFLQGYYDWQWELAQRTLDRALEINPNLAIAHYHDAWFHVLFGRMEEAIEAHKRAQQLDPLMPLHTGWLGGLYNMDGRYQEAIVEAQKAIDMAPGFPVGYIILAEAHRAQGRLGEAIEAARTAVELAPPWKSELGRLYAQAGRMAEARQILTEIESEPLTGWNAMARAQMHMGLGNEDEVFRWLNYEHPHAWLPWIRVLDWFEGLRDDPRFAALLERMNLPPVDS
jgi:tetratricopeptide (TPR) repeat protein